jgi:hypothetical protein
MVKPNDEMIDYARRILRDYTAICVMQKALDETKRYPPLGAELSLCNDLFEVALDLLNTPQAGDEYSRDYWYNAWFDCGFHADEFIKFAIVNKAWEIEELQ